MVWNEKCANGKKKSVKKIVLVLTPNYFKAESALIEQIIATQCPRRINQASISALSYFDGEYVTYVCAI